MVASGILLLLVASGVTYASLFLSTRSTPEAVARSFMGMIKDERLSAGFLTEKAMEDLRSLPRTTLQLDGGSDAVKKVYALLRAAAVPTSDPETKQTIPYSLAAEVDAVSPGLLAKTAMVSFGSYRVRLDLIRTGFFLNSWKIDGVALFPPHPSRARRRVLLSRLCAILGQTWGGPGHGTRETCYAVTSRGVTYTLSATQFRHDFRDFRGVAADAPASSRFPGVSSIRCGIASLKFASGARMWVPIANWPATGSRTRDLRPTFRSRDEARDFLRIVSMLRAL